MSKDTKFCFRVDVVMVNMAGLGDLENYRLLEATTGYILVF